MQAAHQEDDPWDGPIARYLDSLLVGDKAAGVTIEDVLEHALHICDPGLWDHGKHMRVGGTLRRCGWGPKQSWKKTNYGLRIYQRKPYTLQPHRPFSNTCGQNKEKVVAELWPAIPDCSIIFSSCAYIMWNISCRV